MFSDTSSFTGLSEPLSHNVHGTFISQKVNKIRWRPERLENTHYFVTGSTDDEINKLILWDLVENDDEDIYPLLMHEQSYCGDVTELKFMNPDCFVSSSSSGSAYLTQLNINDNGEPMLDTTTAWKDLHHFKNGDECACTDLALNETDLVTVGEDGRLNMLTTNSSDIIRTIENADSCSVQCVMFFKHNEVITSNLRGQMKLWDLKSENPNPSTTFMLSGDQVTPTSLIAHPTQGHVIFAGDELGAITTWDLRNNTYPINALTAHEGGITELKFHPSNPDHLFSGSTAGELWHWFTKKRNRFANFEQDDNMNVWLAPENVKSKLELMTLMPILGKSINSLDVTDDKVICGCDNEALYLINGITIS